jgi:hypothetical protein
VVVVSHLEICGADVVVVNSVFNVLHVVVGDGHANVAELVNQLFLGILSAVSNPVVKTVELLSKGLFSLLTVNLWQLLHFHFVFTHQVLLLLSNIAQVSSRGTSPNLSWWNRLTFAKCWAGSKYAESLDLGTAVYWCSHTNKGVIINSACIKGGVGTNVAIVANLNWVAGLGCVARNAS